MQSKQVFQDDTELERLRAQGGLLYAYEAPVLDRIFSGRSGLRLLDIGCNDGGKTVEWFSGDAISKVIGLEYNRELVERAQAAYGGGKLAGGKLGGEKFAGEKFAFFTCDVEAADFSDRLRGYMGDCGVDRFDVIYLSLVLMHLKRPLSLLRLLHDVLAPGGVLVILEANDEATRLPRESVPLLEDFLAMLRKDPFAGNRSVGPYLPELTAACGYTAPVVWFDAIEAQPGEGLKKEIIFQTLFSYLPEDVALLRGMEPDNPLYLRWEEWLERHFATLREAVLREDTPVSMGIRMFTCGRACP